MHVGIAQPHTQNLSMNDRNLNSFTGQLIGQHLATLSTLGQLHMSAEEERDIAQ